MEDDRKVLDRWFAEEILPLEPLLMGFLRRNWRRYEDLTDLRQDIYLKTYEAARSARPIYPRAFLLTVARNHLINLAKRAKIIAFDKVADLEAINIDTVTPEQSAVARDDLRRLQEGLANLPKRCREVIELRKVQGLSQREVADAMGVGLDTVQRQTTLGIRALADFMLGGSGKLQRSRATTTRYKTGGQP